MVRPFKKSDIEKLLSIGDRFYDEGKLLDKGLRKKYDDLKAFFNFLSSSPCGILLVYEFNDNLSGTIGGIISPWYFDFSQNILTETWFWVDPLFRDKGIGVELMNNFEKIGKAKGASHVSMVTLDSSHEERLINYYERNGYVHLEHHFIKEL